MSEPAWWQRGAIYQIYPRSFADANGDGVGDLKGITGKLDYLKALKVEAHLAEPDLHLADGRLRLRRLATTATSTRCSARSTTSTSWSRSATRASIKLILDWVPNHSSDQHPWFLESRSSRDNPKRDWYVWRDEPNDWMSVFEACGKAWTFDETTQQYYLHSFMPEQPDLNWDNPEVERAMHDVLRFWMDRGVDGLRLDAIAKIAKDPLLRDHVGASRRHDEDWESIHPRLRGIRKVIDEYEDRMIVGEVALQDLHRVVAYLEYGDQLHLAHNFVFIDQDWGAERYADSIADFEKLAEDHAWPAWFLANHDKNRPRSRFDHDGLGAQRARAILVMLYTLRGTPFIYQGEELGLPDATIPPDRVVDVDGRDPERAPIPWTPDAPGHGFTTATTPGCRSSTTPRRSTRRRRRTIRTPRCTSRERWRPCASRPRHWSPAPRSWSTPGPGSSPTRAATST